LCGSFGKAVKKEKKKKSDVVLKLLAVCEFPFIDLDISIPPPQAVRERFRG